MALHVTIAPVVEPFLAAVVKEHSIIEHSFLDTTWINRVIKVARRRVESVTWRQLITATYTWKFDRFRRTLWVPRPKLQSVTSLKYNDVTGVQVTLVEGTDYDVDIDSEPGRVVPVVNGNWPHSEGHINDIELIFKSGYGLAGTDVPEELLQAMLVIIDDLYEHRGGGMNRGTPQAAITLMREYRVNDSKIARWK